MQIIIMLGLASLLVHVELTA